MFLPTINPVQSTSDDHPLLRNTLYQNVLYCSFPPSPVISQLNGKQRYPSHINIRASVVLWNGSYLRCACWAFTRSLRARPGALPSQTHLPVLLRRAVPAGKASVLLGAMPPSPRGSPRAPPEPGASGVHPPGSCRQNGESQAVQRQESGEHREQVGGEENKKKKEEKEEMLVKTTAKETGKMLLVAASPTNRI